MATENDLDELASGLAERPQKSLAQIHYEAARENMRSAQRTEKLVRSIRFWVVLAGVVAIAYIGLRVVDAIISSRPH